MFQLLGAMLAVLVSWGLLGAIFTGVGLLLCRFCRLEAADPETPFVYFWSGWASTLLLLQLWHLQYPVDWRPLAAVAAVGLTGLIACRHALREGLAKVASADKREGLLLALAAAALLVFWANLATGAPHDHDTGLYHMPAVRWNAAYPIVPGLGNLHGRLAFNNSSFLYAAMLDVGPWMNQSLHLSNGLLSVALLLQMVVSLPKAFRQGDRWWVYHLLLLLLLPAVILGCYKKVSSYQPDLIVFLLGILVTGHLLILLEDRRKEPRRRACRVFCVCLLCAVGLTVKISFGPLALTASLLAVAIALVDGNEESLPWKRFGRLAALLVLPALAVATWMIRGVILSGYPIYPLALGGLQVPWRIPEESLHEMRQVIYAWPRDSVLPPSEVLQSYHWLGPWLIRQLGLPLKVVVPLLCAAVGIGSALTTRPSARAGRVPRTLWLALLPAIVSIVFVLFTAPDFRFAGASLWIVGAGSLAFALAQLDRSGPLFRRRFRLTIGFTVLLLFLTVGKASRYVHGVGADGGFHPVPAVRMDARVTDSGLCVYVPRGDDDCAWDAPLPNTPYFNARLKLRAPGDLSRGFVLAAKKAPPRPRTAAASRPASRR